MPNFIRGCLAGFAATAPMTAFMLLAHRRLPRSERYPLPPREIVLELARRAGIKQKLGTAAKDAATVGAHFGYGAFTGSLYAASVKRPTIKSGMAYGLFVWLASYLGFLPAIGVLKPATEHPWRRNVLMITAHVVWGATLAAIVRPKGRILRDKPKRLAVS
jgi:uncharacterized membrane protein YagU involved in acid resistance